MTRPARILLIDDEEDLRDFLSEALGQEGHCVTCLDRGERGPELLSREDFDLVLLDNRLPGMSGIDFLKALKARDLRVPVILMTGYATPDDTIQAVNLGAFDYVVKPMDYADLVAELRPLIDQALEIDWRPKERVRLPGEADPAPLGAAATVMIGISPPMQEVYKLIGRFARTDTPVLIRGETGTGKELVARAIHTNSPRKGRPFVALNCTALNENLLDDELFGHELAAFTGADKVRKGRFEYADGGTLFLDEVGDMPQPLQAKLLRVLENKEVTRIGGNEPIPVDVRVVSATHRDLEAAVAAGPFREDLFYRLNGVTVALPPLRKRGDDLDLLAEHFLRKAAEGTGRPAPPLHPRTRDKLRAHPWPGNIRELRNVVARAVLVCRGPQVMPEDVELRRDDSPEARAATSREEARAALRQAVRWAWDSGQANLWPLLHDLLEEEVLRFTLAELDGNKSAATDKLKMARNTLLARMQKYGLK